MSAAARSPQSSDPIPEQQLLGLALSDKSAIAVMLRDCPPALIRDPFHRRIFLAMRRVNEAREPLTPIRLRAELAGDPAWQSMPEDYLQRLKLASPVTQTVPQIIERLRNEVCEDGRTVYDLRSVTQLSEHAPSPNYLIKGLFAPCETSVIYGEPGSGKSFLATWMAYSIAAGREVFGRRVRQAPAIVAALEGQIGFERRMHAIRDAFGANDQFFWLTQPADLYSNDADVDGLIDAVLKAKASFLVIDTLARAIGPGSENEGRDMGIIVSALDRIRRETGSHVCIVHHCGKDASKGMRGHSSLLGAADATVEVKRDGEARCARLAKVKDGKDGDEHGFTLQVVDLGQDEDGDPITTCIIAPCSDPMERRKAAMSGKAKIAYELLVRAINDGGQPAPAGNHFPRDIHVVPLTIWRKYCYEGLGAERDMPGTSRKAFNRAFANLQNIGRIGTWGDFVWPL